MAALLLFTVVLVVVLAAFALRARTDAGPPDVTDETALWGAARRRARACQWAGLGTGAVAAVVVAQWDALGRGMMLAAPVFALVLLGGVILGELRVSAPATATRSTTLRVRRMRDYLPRRLAFAVLIASGCLLLLLAATTAAGSADDLGHAGRSLSSSCGESHGPWPGSFYSVPVALVVAAGVAAAALALHHVARRPRFGGSTLLEAADESLRLRAGETVTAACGMLVVVPLTGVSITAAGGLLSIACRPVWWSLAGWVLLALIPAALALLGWCVAALIKPRGSVRAISVPAA
jgi:hypothetical protein